MINICKTKNWSKARDSKFTRQSELVFEVKILFRVYSDRLDPGKGWYVLNEELHVSALPYARGDKICKDMIAVSYMALKL